MAGLHDSEKAAEAAEVRAFWQELGLPGLVDVHTHFMPPNVPKAPRRREGAL